jgi:Protein of unknown function (DUF3306)
MTDRDDSSEGFLGRWSRKKIDAEREAPVAPVDPTATAALPQETGLPKRQPDIDIATGTAAAPKLEFDLASLPSLDSITAATDIRAFLGPGVPKELARAALRRAWSADPAIRDFKGLAENDWDFTDPNAMAGFGELPPGYDVKKLLAQIFGDSEKPLHRKTQRPSLWRQARQGPKARLKLKLPIFRGTSIKSPMSILCSAIIILQRTIVISMMRQKSRRYAASMAVHCLNRKSYP